MKLHLCLVYIFIYSLFIPTYAQKHEDVTKSELKSLITSISDSLAYYYVSVDEGITLGNHIKKQYQNGIYNRIKNPDSLAKQLTKDLRSVNNDLHLYVYHHQENKAHNTNESNLYTGLKNIRFYDKDIMYIEFSDFGNWNNANNARQTISNVMPLLQGKKALIIDVRNNPGGVPYVVAHFLSYFFKDNPRKLADYFIRYNNSAYSIYTEPNVLGIKYPNIPIYVLVNNKTASAGEELAFWLQGQNRATIIGQNTIGAGYGAMEYQLNNRFSISISNETEVDPITRQGFQLTGVKPDIITAVEKSLEKAVKLANTQHTKVNNIPTLDSIRKHLDTISDMNVNTISELILNYHNLGILDHSSINQLGYDYLNTSKKAVAILKMNTILYPFYPNSFDSFADALFANKDYEFAEKNYKKAIELATLKNNRNLGIFKNNLKHFQERYAAILKEENNIRATLLDYIEGTSNGETERLKKAFHPDLNLYSVDKNDTLKIWKGENYISAFKEGEKINRVGEILSIDFENNAAVAKVKIISNTITFIDYFLLLKLEKRWTIIHKSYTRL